MRRPGTAPSGGSNRGRNDSRRPATSPSVIRRPNPKNQNRLNNAEDQAGESRIQVVVRIRPLNDNDITRKSKVILQPDGEQKVVVWDPACFDCITENDIDSIDPSCWSRDFAFDRCLWSIDDEDENYASQDTVFEVVGQPVLNWTMAGFNSCIFAFGQTGAGKSHTMMGTVRGSARNYGLIPRICFGIFEHLEAVANSSESDGNELIPDGSDSVTFSHLEIYNESVRDLLAPEKSTTLKIREHPSTGVFVANLTTVNVTTFEEVMSLIAIGDRNRTVAATNSNTHSSRSHAIVTLTVCQRNISAPKHKGVPTSGLQNKIGKIHLVDLAGSERVTLSGATNTRLKEANNINKSLSVLGDVIKSLGDMRNATNKRVSQGHGSGTSLGVHIPYRNSVLTMVLKDSLGGNAHAVMITNVSPSSLDYEETLSTLKYADRAKRVRMKVEANVSSGLLASDSSSHAYLVPLLKAEVKKLKEMLELQQEEHSQLLANRNNSQQPAQFGLSTAPPVMRASEAAAASASQMGYFGDIRAGGGEDPSEVNAKVSGVMQEMAARVNELEKQLGEREKLIDSLTTPAPPEANRHQSPRSASAERNASPRTSAFRAHQQQMQSQSRGLSEDEEYRSSIDAMQQAAEKSALLKPPADPHAVEYADPMPVEGARSGSAGRRYRSQLGSKSSNSSGSGSRGSAPPPSSAHPNSKVAAANSVQQPPVVVFATEDEEKSSVDQRLPRLINLNQDPLFSECLVYYIPEGRTTVGSSADECDILISGLDIKRKHCIIYNKGGCIWVEPLDDAIVFVNGEVFLSRASQLELKQKLGGSAGALSVRRSNDSINNMLKFSLDAGADGGDGLGGGNVNSEDNVLAGRILVNSHRISFGRYHLFRFEHAAAAGPEAGSGRGKGGGKKGWEYAQEELMNKNDSLMRLRSSVSLDARSLVHQYASILSSESATPSPVPDFVDDETGSELDVTGASGVSGRAELGSTSSAGEYLKKSHSAKSVRFSKQLEEFQTASQLPAPGSLDNKPPPPPPVETSSAGKGNSGPTQGSPTAKLGGAGLGAAAAVAAVGAHSPFANESWWERLQRVADGSENANPSELRDMLRLLLTKAEENVHTRKNRIGGGAPLGVSSPSTTASPSVSTSAHVADSSPSLGQSQSPKYPGSQGVSSRDRGGLSSTSSQSGPAKASPDLSAAPPPPPQNPPPPTLDLPPAARAPLTQRQPTAQFVPPSSSNSVPTVSASAPAPAPVVNGSSPRMAPVVDGSPPRMAPPQSFDSASGNPNMLSPNSFEKEARQLQDELAQMQKSLQDRMHRYSHITTADGVGSSTSLSASSSARSYNSSLRSGNSLSSQPIGANSTSNGAGILKSTGSSYQNYAPSGPVSSSNPTMPPMTGTYRPLGGVPPSVRSSTGNQPTTQTGAANVNSRYYWKPTLGQGAGSSQPRKRSDSR